MKRAVFVGAPLTAHSVKDCVPMSSSARGQCTVNFPRDVQGRRVGRGVRSFAFSHTHNCIFALRASLGIFSLSTWCTFNGKCGAWRNAGDD